MPSQSSDVEILVHAAAPSTTAHDAVYRQLARSYLAFEPTQRSCLVRPSLASPGPDLDQGATARGEDDGKHRIAQQPCKRSSQRLITGSTPESSFGGYGESQDLSFESALDNRTSPRLHVSHDSVKASRAGVVASSQHDQPCTDQELPQLPSQIEDSYPMPGAIPSLLSPTRMLENYLQKSASRSQYVSSPARLSPGSQHAWTSSPRDQVNVPSSFPAPDADCRADQSGPVAQQIIPVTPGTTSNAERGQTNRGPRGAWDDEQHHSVFEITHVSGSSTSYLDGDNGPLAADPEANQPKRLKLSVSNDEAQDASSIRTSMYADEPSSSMPIQEAESLDGILEVRPPSPPPSVDDIQPQDLVSDKLAKLARDITSRYRPVVVRDVPPFERGHWRVDCGAWPAETRRDLWLFLTNYVRSGLAGWGVWCRRDASHCWIRIYCWAHVAKHTYLLMYIGSGRHLKATKAEWVDADGHVAIMVPPQQSASISR